MIFISSQEILVQLIRIFTIILIFISKINAQFLPTSGGASLTANNYKLLYKSCSMCDYSIEVDGASSVSNTDNITFSSVAIKDGFYSIGSTDNNL